MGWTERKTGFTDSVPSRISNMGFKAGQREELGGLSTLTTVMPHPDGNDAIMKTFAEKYLKVLWTPYLKEGKTPDITVYQPPSEIPYKDLAPKTMRYWNVVPTYSLEEVARSRGVVLPSPTRILTDAEARVFKKMGERRRVFTFPGSDVDIFNTVLDQTGSIFELIPFAGVNANRLVGTYGILPSGELTYLPNTMRGWLRVRDKYASLALAKDAFNKGLAFENIISVMPTFWYPEGDGGIYETGNVWDTGSIGLVTIHWGNGYLGLFKNTLYPAAYSFDAWDVITKTRMLEWLNSIQANMPYIKKPTSVYELTRNANGWVDYSDHALYDWISSTLGYYTKDNILVAGFTPYWLTAAYNTEVDTLYTTKRISEWWAYEEWGTTDQLHQYFYNMPQYFLYDDTYVPPVQE